MSAGVMPISCLVLKFDQSIRVVSSGISLFGFLASPACSPILFLLIMVFTSNSLISICRASLGVDGGAMRVLVSFQSSILLISLVLF